jgi:hypothetical protein
VPFLVHHSGEATSTELVISQTPVVARYLAQQLGLYPEKLEHQLQADSLMAGVVDWTADGHDLYHPIHRNHSYESQEEEARPFVHYYQSDRMPKWAHFFESVLVHSYGNADKVGKPTWYTHANTTVSLLCLSPPGPGTNRTVPREPTAQLRGPVPLPPSGWSGLPVPRGIRRTQYTAAQVLPCAGKVCVCVCVCVCVVCMCMCASERMSERMHV